MRWAEVQMANQWKSTVGLKRIRGAKVVDQMDLLTAERLCGTMRSL
jgi:hypothetical protein